MRQRFAILVTIVVLLSNGACLAETHSTHFIKYGETLSSIALQKFGKPIYGKNGSLNKVEQLNPQLKKPNFILPGEIIYLDYDSRNVAAEQLSQVPPLAAAPPIAFPKIENTTTESQHFWISLGTGINLVRYSQSVPGVSDVTYQSILVPSLFVKAGSFIDQNWGMEFAYKDSPGEAASTPTIPVINGKYHWLSLNAEGIKVLDHKVGGDGKLDTQANLRFGLQQHFMPFMAAQPSGAIEIRRNTLTMATLGFDFIIGQNAKVRYEFQGRFQYPIASGSSGGDTFSVKSPLGVDGSIGMAYKFNPQWLLGTYWYGQWHHYDFNFYDSGIQQTSSGTQSLFYSNLELRLGYEF